MKDHFTQLIEHCGKAVLLAKLQQHNLTRLE